MNGSKSKEFLALLKSGNPFDTQSNLKRSWSVSVNSEVCRLVGTATYVIRMSGGVGGRVKIPFLPDSALLFLLFQEIAPTCSMTK